MKKKKDFSSIFLTQCHLKHYRGYVLFEKENLLTRR